MIGDQLYNVKSQIINFSILPSNLLFTTVEAVMGQESMQGTPRIKVRNFN
jgi:hypothetical protein